MCSAKKATIAFLSKYVLAFFILLLPANIFCSNITVIGMGRLGICIALSLERAGHTVLGVDISPECVEKINSKTVQNPEPFVELYLLQSNLRATTSLVEGLAFSDICFIAISSTLGTEGYNLQPLTDLFLNINALKISHKHIVINATILPGYVKEIVSLLKDCTNITISYNPPFIAQGAIMSGYNNPDMVLIGQGSQEIGDILETIYKKICPNAFLARMSVESAEIAKLSLNCFITMKIAFANTIADIADQTPGADKNIILKALTKDKRIGDKCLEPGYGFGGPCFPRDNRALGQYALSVGIEPFAFRATDEANRLHTSYMAKKLLGLDLSEYIFQDVSYKPNSPVKIVQESQKLAVAKKIAESGRKVVIIDSKEVISELENSFGDLFSYKSLEAQ